MRILLFIGLFCCLMVSRAYAQQDQLSVDYGKDIQPILSQNCYRCHGKEKQEADLRLDTLSGDLNDSAVAETWHDVLTRLNLGEMPPESEPPMQADQHRRLVGWVTTEMKRTEELRRSNGGRIVLRRLNRFEYQNTMRDLLGLDLDYAKDLPPEPTSPDGFQNNGATLGMSALQLEYYLKTAREALAKVIVTGPRPQVFHFETDQTSDDSKRSKQNKGSSNRLDDKSSFLARVMEFPREGEIRVRVHAHAIIPPNEGFPRLQVALGVRSDTVSPEKVLGEADVTSTEPQVLEFRGRIEEFPLPSANPKFPGLLIIARNIYNEPAPMKRKGKKAPAKEDPSQPIIVIDSVEFEGPLVESWPPESHTRIMVPRERRWSESQYAEEILKRFLPRAYRRPVDQADLAPMLDLFQKVNLRSQSFEDAIRDTLAMVLVSPDFLYLVEPGNEKQRRKLNDFELASRMSYFLWSSMPDEKLFHLAESGKLREPKVLEARARAMLADPKIERFVQQFTDQWLNLSGVDRVAVNPEYYPDFDERLKADMREETKAFFAEILTQDLSGLNLIDSDFAMLNRRLAEHYQVPGPRGTEFERVELNLMDRRGGLLTQGAVLLSNSTGEDSHPIRRAVWLLDRLLDSPPPPPPPDVPELNPEEASLAGLSVKQQLEVHRKKESCNSCHQGIDPWGIPFENYDAIGLWREEVRRVSRKGKVNLSPVVAHATLPGGKQVTGLKELKNHLLENERERFAKALVRRMLAYALGRSLELTDESTVTQLTEQFIQHDYRISDLMVAIIQSEPFQSK
ncbi:DUF1592 domain-containing protein [bacterium]|nr:DUF1592 domain-containing protein [bacterium]